MKYVVTISVLALAISSLAAPSPGVSFARPGATAIVRLELKPDPDVLFNRNGPSLIRVVGPFGKAFEQRLPRGTPYPQDPKNYDSRVPTISFRIPVPKNAKPGAYTVKLEAALFLCDAVQHICYRTTPKLETVIEVGQDGREQDALLELARPAKPGN